MRVKYDKILDELREEDNPPSYATGVVANGLIISIATGYVLEYFLILSQNANAVTINLGTTVGGSELIALEPISGNSSKILRIDYSNGKSLTAFDVYVSSALWGGANLNIFLITKKIL